MTIDGPAFVAAAVSGLLTYFDLIDRKEISEWIDRVMKNSEATEDDRRELLGAFLITGRRTY